VERREGHPNRFMGGEEIIIEGGDMGGYKLHVARISRGRKKMPKHVVWKACMYLISKSEQVEPKKEVVSFGSRLGKKTIGKSMDGGLKSGEVRPGIKERKRNVRANIKSSMACSKMSQTEGPEKWGHRSTKSSNHEKAGEREDLYKVTGK